MSITDAPYKGPTQREALTVFDKTFTQGHPVFGNEERVRALLAKTAPFRNKNEGMFEFFARTGLGTAQIEKFTTEQIQRFLAAVASRPKFEARTPPSSEQIEKTIDSILRAPKRQPNFQPNLEDADLLERTNHVREANEPVKSLIARTGISPAQIRAMSKSEISHFVAAAAENTKHETKIKPKLIPQRFVERDGTIIALDEPTYEPTYARSDASALPQDGSYQMTDPSFL